LITFATMKITLPFLFTICVFSNLFGQNEVTWKQSFDNQKSTLIVKAELKEGWHLYSQHIDEYAGPVATSFSFSESKDLIAVGRTLESESVLVYDANFESEVAYFNKKASFFQVFEVKNTTLLTTTITFMVCNDVMCLPPEDIELSMQIPQSLN
jgi:hypothetical protein